VATRKVLTLLDCGAAVTVVSPAVTAKLRTLAAGKTIRLKKRTFRSTDLNAMFLVFGATDNEALNRKIHAEAERLGLLCNIADRPEHCNFILPSVVNRGDLIIAISTSGQSPAFAKKLRKDLETAFGNEYTDFLKLMGAIRKRLLSLDHKPEVHKPLFEQLLNRDLLGLIKAGKIKKVNAVLLDVLGRGFEFESLMNS
jgi:precorrin-2 dehydrogenase